MENDLIASELKEFRKANKVFVVPNLKELSYAFLDDLDNIDDSKLVTYMVGINSMLTRSKVNLEYLQEKAHGIERMIDKGEERLKQRRRNQAKTHTNRKSRKNRKTRRY